MRKYRLGSLYNDTIMMRVGFRGTFRTPHSLFLAFNAILSDQIYCCIVTWCINLTLWWGDLSAVLLTSL